MNDSRPNSPVAQQLWFTAAQTVVVRIHNLPALAADDLLIAVQLSAISAGTEMLVYRGQIPTDIALDDSIAALQTSTHYPLQYGYAAVGIVEQIGTAVDSAWLGKRVFAFQPHASYFIAQAQHLIEIPEDISSEAALFLPNMETAVNLIQDGAPALGERVVVLGQGIVGLLLSALLVQYPLAQLHVLDTLALRRARALQLGVTSALDPLAINDVNALRAHLNLMPANAVENDSSATGKNTGMVEKIHGADLIYEVSGVPEVLNSAIAFSGFSSRIVIGSWYGTKTAPVMLGGAAHRNRLTIITSQVSSIAPVLSGRWNKNRRFDLVWDMLRRVKPEQFISHRTPIADAANLYQQLDQTPHTVLQAILTYPH